MAGSLALLAVVFSLLGQARAVGAVRVAKVTGLGAHWHASHSIWRDSVQSAQLASAELILGAA